MRFLTLPKSKVADATLALLEDPEMDIGEYLEWAGGGIELDTTVIEDAVVWLRNEHAEFVAEDGARDLDIFEGVVAGKLHAAIESAGVAPVVLDDPGFWAYLTVRYFWWFVVWRQESTFEGRDFGKYKKYVDGTDPAECVVLRSYLRGRLVHRPDDEDPYRLATAIPYGTDFWRSHVIRVQTGSSPVLTRAFAEEQSKDRMTTEPLREYARRLNRMWSNVVLHVYEESEAADVISELR